MQKILIFTQWFKPALKAGGPVKSCVDIVNNLKFNYTFYIFTSAFDLGSETKLDVAGFNQWLQSEDGTHVYYCTSNNPGIGLMNHILKSIEPDIIYLNSFFSKNYTVLPILLTQWSGHNIKTIVACRGMVKPSALQVKKLKKAFFIRIIKMLGIPNNLHFHVTNEKEKDELIELIGPVRFYTADNFPGEMSNKPQFLLKSPGKVQFVFIGRVHPIKNLHFLLSLFSKLQGNINLTIIGSWEDLNYLKKCQDLLKTMPERVQINFTKELPAESVLVHLQQSHALVLPTLGENYGHVIVESLAQSRPVVISDQTPWSSLAASEAGWDLPLSSEIWISKLQQIIDWDQTTFDAYCKNARDYLITKLNMNAIIDSYKVMFS